MSDPNYSDRLLICPFDGADGATSATDYSPLGNAVTFSDNAQLDTALKKYGTASALFDGTDDYITFGSGAAVTGTGDFTIEFWVRAASWTSSPTLWDQRPASTNGLYPCIYVNTSGQPIIYVNSTDALTSTDAISTGTWAHVAWVRDSGTSELFVDGVLQGTFTDTNNYLNGSGRPIMGVNGFLASVSNFDGNIDDLRVSARAEYTANFTPPTSAHPTVGTPEAIIEVPSPLAAPELLMAHTSLFVSAPSPLAGPKLLIQNAAKTFLAVPGPLSPPAVSITNDFSAFVTGTVERYVVRVIGEDVTEIPASSWQATRQTDRQDYLMCVIPNASEYSDLLSSLIGVGEFAVYSVLDLSGVETYTEIARAPIDTAISYEGPFRDTVVLSGYNASEPVAGAGTINLTGIRQTNQTLGGNIRVRAGIDWRLQPGQEVTDGQTTFTANYINYFMPAAGDAYMDVGNRG